MDLSEALERIDAIHSHLARGEAYRGYHPQALAVSGLLGLGAAFLSPATPAAFVAFWVGAAGVAAGVGVLPTLWDYLTRDDADRRRRTLIILRQFAPCLLAGAALTAALPLPACLPHLPGVWALLFGLGAVSSLPYLPRGAWVVAAWYFGVGLTLLLAAPAPVPPGWSVGVPFGVGQMLAAWVMFATRGDRHGA